MREWIKSCYEYPCVWEAYWVRWVAQRVADAWLCPIQSKTGLCVGIAAVLCLSYMVLPSTERTYKLNQKLKLGLTGLVGCAGDTDVGVVAC